MKRMEVRCCCTPNKLLGSLWVPDSAMPGIGIGFPLMRPRARSLEAVKASNARTAQRSFITLEVTHWMSLEKDTDATSAGERSIEYPGLVRRSGIALKREGLTVEQLRLIPGFIEATP